MFETLIFTLIIVAVSLTLLCVRMILVKGGKFPNSHVSGSKAMRERGIGCVQSQDREAQRKRKFDINALEQALGDL